MRANHAHAVFLAILVSLLLNITVDAFVPFKALIDTRHAFSAQPAFASSSRRRSDDDAEEEKRYQDALAHNKIRTDVNNFLTQRAIQSFIFLLVECRDPHTVRWMEVSSSSSSS